jgi:squalene cyclase
MEFTGRPPYCASVPVGKQGPLRGSIAAHAVGFVVRRRGEDGRWRDFLTLAGEATDWPTGFIGEQMLLAGSLTGLRASANALVSSQHGDGGWGYHPGVPTDADSTACVLLFLARLGERGQMINRAVECLVRHQHPDSGGFATYADATPIRSFMALPADTDLAGWCSEHVEVTATAGRALGFVGGRDNESRAFRAWQFVRARQRADGSWRSYWWIGVHYPTWQAVRLAAWARDNAAIARATAWLVATQHADGSWADEGRPPSAFATACALHVLDIAGETSGVRRAVGWLRSSQQGDGGWPSELIMRIPPPHLVEPVRWRTWREDGLGSAVLVRDQHRLFTTALCASALASLTG